MGHLIMELVIHCKELWVWWLTWQCGHSMSQTPSHPSKGHGGLAGVPYESTCFPCTTVSFSPPAVISLQCRSIMQGFLPRILPFNVWLYGMISYSFQLKVHLGPCWSIFEDSCHEWKTHVFNIWTWLTLSFILLLNFY